MNLGRVAAISRKEFLQVRRDPRSLLIALFMPIMLLGLLGYGVRLDAKHVPIYVFDRDGSQDSQALLKRFQIGMDVAQDEVAQRIPPKRGIIVQPGRGGETIPAPTPTPQACGSPREPRP